MASFAFIMDPLSSVKPKKDTSFAFMTAAHNLGHEIHFVPVAGLAFDGTTVQFHATPVRITDDASFPFDVGETQWVSSHTYTAVFVRPDPPFDERYFLLTQLLDHVIVPVFNSPSGLRNVGEKLWALGLPGTPITHITQDKARFLDVLSDLKRCVIKPVDGFGGAGVFVLSEGDTNAAVAFETLSKNGAFPVVIQPFLEEAKHGDKRVLTFDGDILGAIRRVHSGSDHRNNLAAGGTAAAAEVTVAERTILNTILPGLMDLGIRFVGFDFIGEKLIEVNVTSPTGLQELMRFSGRDFATEIILKLCKESVK
ncbi:MAG: glutathione synthase [bacterium]|nr:glutathione synthase [bacterium]